MQRKGARFRGMAWLFAGVALWVLAAGALSAWKQYVPAGRVSVRNESAAFTQDDVLAIEKVMEEDLQGGRAAGFAQQLSKSVSAKETAGSATVDVLWVAGDASLAMEVTMITGNLPVQGDGKGCALSANTARTLFGSTNILGKAVTLGDAELIVRGVFEGPQGVTTFLADPGREMMFAPIAAASEDTTMTALTILPRPTEGQTPVEAAKEAMQLAGVSTGGTITDHSDTRALLGILTGVPALLLLAAALVTALSCGIAVCKRFAAQRALLKENRLTPRGQYIRLFTWCAGTLAALAGLCALAVWLLPDLPAIPPAYLPTAWSNFSHWTGLFTDATTNVAKGALTIALRPDMIRDTLTGWAIVLALLAAFCLWHGRGLLKEAGEGMTLPAAILALSPTAVAMPFGLWLTGYLGWPPTALFAMMALPALPILIYFFIMKGALYVNPLQRPRNFASARRGTRVVTFGRTRRGGRGHGAAVPGDDSVPAGRV